MAEDPNTTNGQNAPEVGDGGDFSRGLLPPIGGRGSRRFEPPAPPPEVDKFSRAMDKVLAERALTVEAPSEENAAGHIIARRESQMAHKHGIAKVGKGVVEKFHAARHNTAIMSAMGHPGLEKLVAKEEEEKRKRRARVKELTALRTSINLRVHQRSGHESEATTPAPLNTQASTELPNVYAALGQAVPSSRAPSTTMVTSLPPPQPPAQPSSTLPQAPQSGRSAGSAARSGCSKEVTTSPRAALSRSGPSVLRPVGVSTGGASSEWDGQSHSKASTTSRRAAPSGGKWRRRTHSGTSKTGHGSDSVVRTTSRVGRILVEFGGQDDWCSVTVMRHSLATILQANIRGWLVRRKWLANPQAVVDATKAALEAARLQKERRAELKQELERRALTRRQKEKAANVLQMLFPQKSMVGNAAAAVRRGSSGDNVLHGPNASARAKWTRLNKNLDLATEQEDRFDMADSLDGSESDMSDLGLEEMAMVKMRARTPPWQKAEQSQWEGQWAKLNTKTGRGNLDVVWDLSDTAARVQAVQQRRAERSAAAVGPDGKPRSPGGRGAAAVDSQQYDPATQPLPAAVVNELLVHRYIDKYSRLGLMDHLPLRSTAEAVLQQQQLLYQQQTTGQSTLAAGAGT